MGAQLLVMRLAAGKMVKRERELAVVHHPQRGVHAGVEHHGRGVSALLHDFLHVGPSGEVLD